jgi:hypothetical protein
MKYLMISRIPTALGDSRLHAEVGVVVGGFVKLGPGKQRAVVVQNILRAVVQQLAVVRLEEAERRLGRAQVIDASEFAFDGHARRQGQGGDGQPRAGTVAGLVAQRARHALQASGRVAGAGHDARSPVRIADRAIRSQFLAARRVDRFQKRSLRSVDPHQVVGPVKALVQQAAFVLGEVVVSARLERLIAAQ